MRGLGCGQSIAAVRAKLRRLQNRPEASGSSSSPAFPNLRKPPYTSYCTGQTCQAYRTTFLGCAYRTFYCGGEIKGSENFEKRYKIAQVVNRAKANLEKIGRLCRHAMKPNNSRERSKKGRVHAYFKKVNDSARGPLRILFAMFSATGVFTPRVKMVPSSRAISANGPL